MNRLFNNKSKRSKKTSSEPSDSPQCSRAKILIGQNVSKYKIEREIGYGAFGNVFKVICDEKHYALKISRNEERFIKAAKKEADILLFLRDNDTPNVCKVIECFHYQTHPCFVFDLYYKDLYKHMIDVYQLTGAGFPEDFCQIVIKQVLSCLEYLLTFNIIHADLKPENIMLCNPNSHEIKVIDFGSSFKVNQKHYTYIQSRYYRAPEIPLGGIVNCSIDMWSLGCILYEIITCKPLFKVRNTNDLVLFHAELLGVPRYKYIESCKSAEEYYTYINGKYTLNILKSSKGVRKIPGTTTLLLLSNNTLSTDASDFISCCIRYEGRITPEQAILHTYLKNTN